MEVSRYLQVSLSEFVYLKTDFDDVAQLHDSVLSDQFCFVNIMYFGCSIATCNTIKVGLA